MKKMINVSFIYGIMALIAGVFYREFTKFNGFTGRTTLSVMHVHLFALGTIMFLILALFSLNTNIQEQKLFKTFFIIYNIALPFTVIMFGVRGITQVYRITLSKGMDAAISGLAGIGHILIGTALIILFICLRKIHKN